MRRSRGAPGGGQGLQGQANVACVSWWGSPSKADLWAQDLRRESENVGSLRETAQGIRDYVNEFDNL
jgi:hypothetical protein